MRIFCLHVSGEYACFTRPEMKVERVSYDVITPSAARAIFEAILWKPAIAWKIHKIEVLEPIKWFSVRRNEVASKISVRNVQTAMNGGGVEALGLNIEDDRQQRAGLILREVAYRIYGSFFMTDKAGADDNVAKFEAMFERRAAQGQSFHQPYLGCREFPCSFSLVTAANDGKPPIGNCEDLGWMLYDMDYTQNPPTPRFFRAYMNKGVVMVDGAEVRG
ncbi:MAG: type I-C CRISPR-associated protein Cas5 [Alphaproteobacteria bacterium]|jgi:CRISPR-associated protein Cas5d|nr:type I-C CRISPR-associated protein Cas5 [Alphaproteobacteria bacterium]QQS57834.1 MAG: type I-C CRISPR-associated protein Cas5 [Alphaproteobacteria bacterium]